jgi:WD40 repeat protein
MASTAQHPENAMGLRHALTVRKSFGLVAALLLLFLLVGVVARYTHSTPRVTLSAGKMARPRGFSPDGGMLVTCTSDENRDFGPINVWDTHSGELRFAVEEGQQRLGVMRFSPDGRFLAAQTGTRVKLWDVRTGREVANEDLGTRRFFDFTPDGTRLILVQGIHRFPEWLDRLDFWEIESGRTRGSVECDPFKAKFSPDGRQIGALDEREREIKGFRLWKLDGDGGGATPLTQIALNARDAALSPSLDTLASVRSAAHDDTNDEITLWDPTTGAVRASALQEVGAGWIYSLSFAGNGHSLIGHWRDEGRNYKTYLWDLDAGLARPVSLPGDVEVSPDGKWGVRKVDHDVELRQVAEPHRPIALFEDNNDLDSRRSVSSFLTFSPNSSAVKVETEEDGEQGWDAPGWLPFNPFPGTKSRSELRLYRVSDGRRLLTVKDPVGGSQFSPDGQTLVTTDKSGTVRLWNVSSARPVAVVLGAAAAVWLAILFVLGLGRRLVRRPRPGF